MVNTIRCPSYSLSSLEVLLNRGAVALGSLFTGRAQPLVHMRVLKPGAREGGHWCRARRGGARAVFGLASSSVFLKRRAL